MKYGLCILENPNKTFSFVGSVPAELAYISNSGEMLTANFISDQLRLPAKYRSIKTRVWNTKQDALNEAKILGYIVTEPKENQ